MDSKAIHGNSTVILHYQFRDESLQEKLVYYRLKQWDYNGEYDYSPIIRGKFKPESPKVWFLLGKSIHFSKEGFQPFQWTLYGSRGEKILMHQAFPGSVTDLSSLPDGYYYLRAGDAEAIKIFLRDASD